MDLLSEVVGRHFDNFKEISADRITLSDDVRKLCEQNKCGQYGKNWTCPPAIKSVDEFRKDFASFDTFLIVYKVYCVKSSFDWRGMMAGGTDFKDRLYDLKQEISVALPKLRFLLLGAGGCHLCERCAYMDGEPCRQPEDAMISLEACGIDVMSLMKDNGLKYYHGKNTVTFIGGILY
jgi:predicted metal-binding protein